MARGKKSDTDKALELVLYVLFAIVLMPIFGFKLLGAKTHGKQIVGLGLLLISIVVWAFIIIEIL